MKYQNTLCKLFGHKPDDITDSGYEVCKRCGSHSYYDEWHKNGFLLRPIWIIQIMFTNLKWRIRSWIARNVYDRPF